MTDCTICGTTIYRGPLCFDCLKKWAPCLGGPIDGDVWRLHALAERVNKRLIVQGWEYVYDDDAKAYVCEGARP